MIPKDPKNAERIVQDGRGLVKYDYTYLRPQQKPRIMVGADFLNLYRLGTGQGWVQVFFDKKALRRSVNGLGEQRAPRYHSIWGWQNLLRQFTKPARQGRSAHSNFQFVHQTSDPQTSSVALHKERQLSLSIGSILVMA